MPWACAVRDKEDRIVLMEEGKDYPADDYRADVHVVPFVYEGETMVFGIHDFTRTCPCGINLQTSEWSNPIVVHTDRVN